MTPESVIDIIRTGIQAGGAVAGPILLVSLFVGVTVSIIQTVTQVQDFTLVFVPKILATILAIATLGSWMLQSFVDFTRQMLLSFPALVG